MKRPDFPIKDTKALIRSVFSIMSRRLKCLILIFFTNSPLSAVKDGHSKRKCFTVSLQWRPPSWSRHAWQYSVSDLPILVRYTLSGTCLHLICIIKLRFLGELIGAISEAIKWKIFINCCYSSISDQFFPFLYPFDVKLAVELLLDCRSADWEWGS